MANFEKRDILQFAIFVSVAAVFFSIIAIGTSNVVASLIVAFVAAIVAILIAWKFASRRIDWILVAFIFMVAASWAFNEAHSSQWLALVAFLASAVFGLVVSTFVDKDDDGIFSIRIVFPTIASFFIILTLSATFVSKEWLERLDESILLIFGGLLSLGFVVLLGGSIYYAARDRWGQDGKRKGMAIEGALSSAQNEDDAIKKLARFLSGINNEILKPLFLVILVCLPLYFFSLIFKYLNLI